MPIGFTHVMLFGAEVEVAKVRPFFAQEFASYRRVLP